MLPLESLPNYLLNVPDTDYLWFNRSEEIFNLIKETKEFYVGGQKGGECISHNRLFMENSLDLKVALNFNSGLMGINLTKFYSLTEIERILELLWNAEKTFLHDGVETSSRGVLWQIDKNASDE